MKLYFVISIKTVFSSYIAGHLVTSEVPCSLELAKKLDDIALLTQEHPHVSAVEWGSGGIPYSAINVNQYADYSLSTLGPISGPLVNEDIERTALSYTLNDYIAAIPYPPELSDGLIYMADVIIANSLTFDMAAFGNLPVCQIIELFRAHEAIRENIIVDEIKFEVSDDSSAGKPTKDESADHFVTEARINSRRKQKKTYRYPLSEGKRRERISKNFLHLGNTHVERRIHLLLLLAGPNAVASLFQTHRAETLHKIDLLFRGKNQGTLVAPFLEDDSPYNAIQIIEFYKFMATLSNQHLAAIYSWIHLATFSFRAKIDFVLKNKVMPPVDSSLNKHTKRKG